ncbi:hypothetical protein [Cribrihabitans neustonicus]|uniref:hypothetical protein n=1 Tax=Cribrihabitans neustonicus TaxID=1429085 RepID=UPI003B5A7BB1
MEVQFFVAIGLADFPDILRLGFHGPGGGADGLLGAAKAPAFRQVSPRVALHTGPRELIAEDDGVFLK